MPWKDLIQARAEYNVQPQRKCLFESLWDGCILMTITMKLERKRVERKPHRARHIENCLLSLPSMQFHPRSLDFSGGTAHTAGNA